MVQRTRWALALVLVVVAGLAQAAAGFVVLAPDRGFVGNNQTRAAFEPFAAEFDARLVFVTDERSDPYFRRAAEELVAAGADRLVLPPLYLAESHPDFDRIGQWRDQAGIEMVQGRTFGNSYLAAAVLADRIAAASVHGGRLVVVGHGADNAESAERMTTQLQRLAAAAADGFHFDDVQARVLRQDADIGEAVSELGEGDWVLPFHLGPMFSEMMAYSNWLRRSVPERAGWIDGEVTPHSAVTAWMRREANRHLDPGDDRLGVIVHAHGSDFHWNETMREAAAPLGEDYLLEYAFSMGGAGTLGRAVRRLEERGARAVVIVRVFSMANSFLGGIERLIGADYESCASGPGVTKQGHGHGAPPARLETGVPIVTVGGLEDHPLFARALLDRARAISRDPADETVILVAHGKGDDAGNAQWLDLLGSLRDRMVDHGGDAFRAIRVGTWREDWPDKREAAMRRMRAEIEQANKDGGQALVVPARTTGQGPARELLPDLEFRLGEGFAPHPLFVEWLREQVQLGREALFYGSNGDWTCGRSG
jgi:sirohydrochlorin ferrochelatase